MNYLKKIYLNWFILGFTLGLVPYVLSLIINNKDITMSSIVYVLFLAIPTISLTILRKFIKDI